jgi:hypothetical protein
MSSGTPDLSAVRDAATLLAYGRERLEAEISKARAAGAPLRAIAEAAGLTHETVRELAG